MGIINTIQKFGHKVREDTMVSTEGSDIYTVETEAVVVDLWLIMGSCVGDVWVKFLHPLLSENVP